VLPSEKYSVPARRLKIVLLSPKGPLYRHRGGIWKKSLRYQPLTLTTLAALIPRDVAHTVVLFDEGISDVPLDLDVDVVGITVITGTAVRAYELADHFRARGITVVLGGPHVTLIPDDAQPHADAVVVGYAEESWPQLLRDVRDGVLAPRYTQAPALEIGGRPFPRRDLLPSQHFLTNNVFEATRGCVHPCEFCVVPTAWGQKAVPEAGARSRRRHPAARGAQAHLRRPQHHCRSPLRGGALHRPHPVAAAMVRAVDRAPRRRRRAAGAGPAQRVRRAPDGAGVALHRQPQGQPEGVQLARALRARGGAAARARHRAARVLCLRLDEDHPDVFLKTAEFAVQARIDLPRFAVVTPFPNTPLYNRLDAEGRILTKNWELYDAQHVVFQPKHMSVQELQLGIEAAWKHAYSYSSIWRRLRHSPAPWPVRIGTNLGYRFYAHNLSRFYNCDWIIGRASGSGFVRPRRDENRRCRWPRETDAQSRSFIRASGAPGTGATSARGRWSRCPPRRSPASRRATSRSASTTTAWRTIPFDEPTDLVAISVETYTAGAPTRSPASTAAAASRW
jgi:hypothetical protein